MNLRRIGAVMLKDWKELLRNPQAVVPVILLPVVLAGVLPAALILFGANPALTASINGMDAFINNLPDGVIPRDFDLQQGIVYALLVYFFAPMFLLIPVIASMVAASNSFAGERERRSLEGLLFSPLRTQELVISKIAVSFIPSLALTWLAFILYMAVVNLVGTSLFGRAILPTPSWLVLMLLLAPAVGFLVVTLVVFASQHARTVQSAQSVAAFMVLPLIGLVIAQVTGLALFNVSLALLLTLVVVVVDISMVLLLVKRFDRESLILKL